MALSLGQYPFVFYNDTKIKHILKKRIERQRKKALRFSIKNGNQIPEDLIVEILSRLPVKTLLQFKSVSKLWYDIIKSSHFTSKHLRNYYYDNNNNWRDCLIVQHSVRQGGKLNMYELLVGDKKNRVLSYQWLIDARFYDTYMCGPCDGIYYLSCFSNGPKRSLWNPALNEFKILPDITLKVTPLPCSSDDPYECYGFGYDSKTDDYKVIIILDYDDDRFSIFIYSLRSNSWRYWGDMDNSYSLAEHKNVSYAFVKGCYYWLVSRLVATGWNYDMIVSFDISADTCQEISLPKFKSSPGFGSQLIVYQDSIAFVYVPDNNTSFSIWTWNTEVWTQKLNMKLDFQVWGAFSEWRDKMLVFRQVNGKLVLLDTKTKEIIVLDDPKENGCVNICAYKVSLVSIKDFGNDVKHKGRTS